MADTLTLRDQVVINAAGYLVHRRLPNPKKERVAVSLLHKALPKANADHAHLGPVVAAAQELVPAWHAAQRGETGPWCRARMDMDAALANFFFWRMAVAQDQVAPQPEAEIEGAAV